MVGSLYRFSSRQLEHERFVFFKFFGQHSMAADWQLFYETLKFWRVSAMLSHTMHQQVVLLMKLPGTMLTLVGKLGIMNPYV